MKTLPSFPAPGRRLLGALLALTGWIATALPAAAEPLTLRINDAEARPGGRVAIVVRTYAPRGLGQGQLCFRAFSQLEAEGGAGPFVAMEDFIVWSSNGDAIFDGQFDPVDQSAILDFTSVTGGINLEDGPMAALILRLRDDIAEGSQFEVHLDGAESFLFDADGIAVPLEIRPGDLEVVHQNADFNLAAEGDEVPPGGLGELGISTQELFPIAGGQVAFEYDPQILQGTPTVTVDGRHGHATFTIDSTQSGRILVSFSSPDQSLNSIPGQFIRLSARLRHDLPVGTMSVVSLDPSLTFLDGPGGPYPLILEDDVIEVVPVEVLFGNGFESGTLDGWSSHAP